MVIKITNYSNEDVVNISLPLLIGEVIVSGDSKIFVQNLTAKSDSTVWPVINGKFKVLTHLQKGKNEIQIQHKSVTLKINLNYEPLKCKRFVRLVYIKCVDDEGFFQAPSRENNCISSACSRIILGAQMLQTFTYDKFKEHNLPKKTFRLEEQEGEIICHVFTSSLKLCQAYDLNEEQLWAHFAVELMNSNLRVGNDCKFLAFLSFTRYSNTSNMPPQSHQEILKMMKGQVALGGGGLALFGSGCLHTWPENIQEVPWRFGDKRKIDRMKFMDDSANRGFYWACYATGLGATLHELGHTFDLGHTKGGIMGRGFDDIYKYFIVDMFYYDNLFQREYNPHYVESTVYNQTISITPTSPTNKDADNSLKFLSLEEHSNMIESLETKYISEDLNFKVDTRPWKLPNPPEVYPHDFKDAFNVGGAYWTRASALILYYHKWFNDVNCHEKDSINFENLKIASTHGIQIIEFRDSSGTLFHHVEYPEGEGCPVVDLALLGILKYVPDESKEVTFVAEDSVGNIFKTKLNVSKLS